MSTCARRQQRRHADVRTGGLVALSAVGLLLAAGCGSPGASGNSGDSGTGDSVAAQLNALPADEQADEAAQRAKKDGTVSLYTNINAGAADNLVATFQKATGIKVELYRGSSEDVLQRVEQEKAANKLGADVVFGSFDAVSALGKDGTFTPYKGASLDDLDKDMRFGTWTEAAAEVFVPAWNTNLIPAADQPKTWADLADPRFDGKITLEAGDVAWYASLTGYWKANGKSDQQIDKLWHDIVDGAHVASGHSGMVELLSAGQTGMNGANYDYLIRRARDKGAPVAYPTGNASEGIPGFPSPLGVGLTAQAEHQAAGWLLVDWLLGKDGQQFLADNGLVTAQMLSNGTVVDDMSLARYATKELSDNRKQWEDRYDALLRGVPTQ